MNISYTHVLKLLLNQYHDGRYLNGHPEIAEWLDQAPEKTWFIEQLDDELGVRSYSNVRVWSSVEACEQDKRDLVKAREFYGRLNKPEKRVLAEPLPPREPHPLELQLIEAVEKKQLERIIELKARLRALGISYDKHKTSIKTITKL